MSSFTSQRELPIHIRDYFFSDEVFDRYQRIVTEFALQNTDAVPILSELIHEFVTGVVSLDDLQDKIQFEFLLNSTKAQDVLSSLFLHVISPIAQDLPEVTRQIESWGEKAKTSGEKMSPATLIRFYIAPLSDTLTSVEQHRLEGILMSYLQGVRTKEETLAFLQRPNKLGGMEIQEQTAKEMIDSFEVQRASVSLEESSSQTISADQPKVVVAEKQDVVPIIEKTDAKVVVPTMQSVLTSKPTVAPIPKSQTPVLTSKPKVIPQKQTIPPIELVEAVLPAVKVAPMVPAQKSKSVSTLQPTKTKAPVEPDVFSKTDAAEIEQIKTSKSQPVTEQAWEKSEELVDRICQHEAFSFTDPHLQKRCQDIVNARVRDVRDASQTREVFERAVEAGGLGVTGRRLADMIEQIELVVDAVQEKHRQALEKERQDTLLKKQQSQEERKILETKETKNLSKRYAQTTGKVPTESINPAAPTLSRASAALSTHMQLQQQDARIDTGKVRAAVEKTVKDRPSVVPTSKAQVKDIRSVPRLTGPLEELQTLGLTEFRRLAKDPEQAINRIKDVVQLLKDQGYEKQVQGIRTLQASPLMQLYGSVMQEAMSQGKTIDAVLAEQTDGLKKNEYQALMKLNADLRF